MNANALDIFDNLTKQWFESALGEPTPVQQEAWPAIAAGGHTLVSAPTGTGKTLSAFLVFIDRLKSEARAGTLKNELRLIYISPLKALAGDIRENLNRPLNGILTEELRAGVSSNDVPHDIDVSLRTGDTTAAERRKMIKSPPHILITTPESLYLLLSSMSGQSILRTARAIIIDELHALIDTKRGAHLMLSLARLDRLCPAPLQRIGLSATIEPLSAAAEYLAGSYDTVTIAAPKMKKEFKIAVTSPIEDMRVLPQGTIWPEIARSVYDLCEGNRSVIAFVDGRMFAEKLAYYVNQIGGENFARTHHGCVSKEQRFEAENDLRSGKLRLLCATSSMELGIDVGDIDCVMQIGHPCAISSVMQRLGRAGHNPGRISVMHMFPRTAAEGLYCGMTAKAACDGVIERLHPPRFCLDVLAQHLVSMAGAAPAAIQDATNTQDDSPSEPVGLPSGYGYTVDEVLKILKHAYPFRDVTREDVNSLLRMLAGDYEHNRDLPVRPRIWYDRIHERFDGDAYSRMLALSTGGTIPDTGMFTVRAENGAKLGELDEEFVFEARVGDKFLLGSFAWKIMKLDKDTVTVAQSTPEGARPPFWRNAWLCRRLQTGLEFGRMMRELTDAGEHDSIVKVLRGFGLDGAMAVNTADFLVRQLEVTGVLPDDRTIIVEHFGDDANDYQVVVHSVFGRQVNSPLALLLQEAAKRVTNMDISCFEDDDGILLMSNGGGPLPEGLLQSISPDMARSILSALLPATPLFNMTFRYNAGRALMMGVRKGKRQPLWIQRLRSVEMLNSVVGIEDHPMVRETRRECLEDYWDLAGLESVLNRIRSGAIQVRELSLDEPSPMSLPLRRQAEATLLYDYSPTTSGINRTAEEALKELQMIKPAAEQLAKLSERKKLPEDEKQLHSLLMIEGDLIAGELNIPLDWFESLARQDRAKYIEPGLWIAAEHEEEYAAALGREAGKDTFTSDKEAHPNVSSPERLEARLHIVRRVLRYRGAQYPESIADRYFWAEESARNVLKELCANGSAVESDGLYYHADLYERARHETISSRRRQVVTMPPERYAALLAGRVRVAAPPGEQLDRALKSLCGQSFSPALWESVLLPVRVNAYRPSLLDTLLSGGGLFWSISQDGENLSLSFHQYDDIDWETGITSAAESLDGDERIIYEVLLKRGASFVAGLSSVVSGRPVHDTLLSLVEKGFVHADSFIPVRQLVDKEKIRKSTAKQRANSRVMTLTSGRWDLARPLINRTAEQQLELAFDKAVVLCRETAQNLIITWSAALETLRVWEYTGRVRRGYFIEGLSGAQFIRENDFSQTVATLENPIYETIWLPAVDPSQPWGKYLSHLADRSFTCVQGTVVALRAGVPVAVFERQGHTLRVFDREALPDALRAFVKDYAGRRVFPSLKRLVVKQYPEEAASALSNTGFTPLMMDYVLYQGHL